MHTHAYTHAHTPKRPSGCGQVRVRERVGLRAMGLGPEGSAMSNALNTSVEQAPKAVHTAQAKSGTNAVPDKYAGMTPAQVAAFKALEAKVAEVEKRDEAKYAKLQERTEAELAAAMAVITGITGELTPRTFSTGSRGYQRGGKIKINGKAYQCNVLLTEIGSKPAKQ